MKSQATAQKQENKIPLHPMAKSTLLNKSKIKDHHQKLSLQLFKLKKSTQFSYQHHFITVTNKKHTDIY